MQPAQPPPPDGPPPWPYALPRPPAKQDPFSPILIILMVLIVVGIVLYSVLAILLGPRPIVTFSAISLSNANATIGVAGASQAVCPSNYRVNHQVGQVTRTAVAMPTTGGTFVNVVVSGTTYRIYWTDIGGEHMVNSGDNFRITGNGVRLPDATPFTFYLSWREGSSIQSAVWTTP